MSIGISTDSQYFSFIAGVYGRSGLPLAVVAPRWKEIDLNNSNHSKPTKSQARVRYIAISLLLIAAVCALVLGLSNKSRISNDATLQDVALTDGVDATHFDPIASYPQVLAIAGSDADLYYISASHVSSDGTVDLTASSVEGITYNFE